MGGKHLVGDGGKNFESESSKDPKVENEIIEKT